MRGKEKFENHVSFKGNPETVIWKSDVTTLQKKSKIFSRKDCDVIFLRKGAFLAAFNDLKEFNVINDKASAFGPLFKKEKEISECHIYYINRIVQLENKWGTPNKIDVYDKSYDMHTSVGANGSYKFSINNSLRLFSKVQGSGNELSQEMLQDFFRSELNSEIRNAIATVFIKNKYGLNDIAVITSKEKAIALDIKEILIPIFNEYGVELEKFFIERFIYDEDFLNSLSGVKKESILNRTKFDLEKGLRKGQRKEAKKTQDIATPEAKYCNECGHMNPINSNFCSKCGSKL